ncbi:ParA family protein [Dyella sp.]|uniref:ParA family protein n=1 Tax=Dyella sp. TaxID=1869338 RepID=UPI002B8697B5|nr:ParA family protein [Rhodanobacteraceae bacterium]
MKTLVIANQKGGVGKTTLLVHIAHYAAEAGNRVLVIDLDPQRNTTASLVEFASAVPASALFEPKPLELPSPGEAGIVAVGADPGLLEVDRAKPEVISTFVNHLRSFSEAAQFDLCLIDTAPALGVRMLAAVAAASHVISPIELQSYSIAGITAMLKTIYGIRQKLNPALQVIGMLPSRVNSHSPAQKANLVSLLQRYPELVVHRAILLRTSIGEAASEKKPVWAMRKTSAREAGREMKGVIAHLIERMGGLPHGA